MRFKWVENARKLERQLDNLVLGGLKLHVNIPMHGREWNPIETVNKKHQQKEEVAIEKVEERDKGKGKGTAEHMTLNTGLQQQNPQREATFRSYPNVVAADSMHVVKRWTLKYAQASSMTSRSSIQLTLSMNKKAWLTKAWIGRLRNLMAFDRLDEVLMWDGGEELNQNTLAVTWCFSCGSMTQEQKSCAEKESKVVYLCSIL